MTPLLLLLVVSVVGDNKCLGPGDCNARNCEDCK